MSSGDIFSDYFAALLLHMSTYQEQTNKDNKYEMKLAASGQQLHTREIITGQNTHLYSVSGL